MYQVENANSGEVLSMHRTRQGAVDAWRVRHTGQTVRVYRRQANGEPVLVAEGIWHEAKRPRDAPESDVEDDEALDLPVDVAAQVANAIPWRQGFPEPAEDEQ